jgi:Ner family transcriptional regulator
LRLWFFRAATPQGVAPISNIVIAKPPRARASLQPTAGGRAALRSTMGDVPRRHAASKASAGAEDWHPADVLAALKKRGRSLSGLSVENGYNASAAGKALKQPWPAMELIIATALQMTPQEIWPSRYDLDGKPQPRSKT